MKKCLLSYIALIGIAALMLGIPVSAASTETINNASLMPKYKTDDQVTLEGYSPDWVKSLIMAEIRIETATPEGTFQAATKVLDHYQEMGVNCLWLCPIYQRDEEERILSGDNGYGSYGPGTIDNKMTGTDDYDEQIKVVKNFVDEAHKRNIRVIFDIVVWGVSKTAPIVQEHPEYFKDSAGNYNEVWGGYGYRWGSPEWHEWYVSTSVDLIMKTGADGYRVDLEPTITGYGVFKDIRTRLANQGKYVMIMAEGTNERRETYDLEQSGVGMHMRDGVEAFTSNYFLKNNIVDSITSGAGIGDAKLQANYMGGRFQYYTCTVTYHDTYNAMVRGNRLALGYQSIFAPFIPLWYIGEEWNNPYKPQYGSGPIYYNKIDWETKETAENTAFFEDIKKYIQIRRSYTDIFEYFPSNHRETNIAKLETQYLKKGTWTDNSLQAYVRYGTDKAILIVPNNTNQSAKFKIQLDFEAMKIGGAKGYRITDLYSGKELLDDNAKNLKTLEAEIASKDMGIYLVEMTTGAGGNAIHKDPLGATTTSKPSASATSTSATTTKPTASNTTRPATTTTSSTTTTTVSTDVTSETEISNTLSTEDVSDEATSGTNSGTEESSDAGLQTGLAGDDGEKGNFVLWIVLACVGLVAVGCLVFFIVRKKKQA